MKKLETIENLRNISIDLSTIGGNRSYSVYDLVAEVRAHRRNNFFEQLFAMKDGEVNAHLVFNAMTFLAATEDFTRHVSYDVNYEGEITYDITAGGDWVWHCQTTVTWSSILPVVGGAYQYHTTVVPNGNVNNHHLNAMTGTGMEIKVVKNTLHTFSFEEAAKRDKI